MGHAMVVLAIDRPGVVGSENKAEMLLEWYVSLLFNRVDPLGNDKS